MLAMRYYLGLNIPWFRRIATILRFNRQQFEKKSAIVIPKQYGSQYLYRIDLYVKLLKIFIRIDQKKEN